MDPGHLIAINLVLLYPILGPLFLFAIYVLFDSLAKSGRPDTTQQDNATDQKDPALWTNADIDEQIKRI